MRSRFSRSRSLWFSRRLWRRRLVFWAGALAVGVVSVGFAEVSVQAQNLFGRLAAAHFWAPLLVTPAGLAASAWLCRTVFPGAQGSGIPQAIAARHLRTPDARQKLLSLRITAGKIALTLLGLLSGASIGREGPTVQVGASIMAQVARLGGMGRERGLILAGSAAGVAAAFNTPLAGIVFAIEEMSRTFESRTSFLVLSAVILSGVASLGMVGNYSYFGQTTDALGGPQNWLAVVACGFGGGALGALFSRLVLVGMSAIRAYVAPAPNRRTMLMALGCGIAIAIIGLVSGNATWGTGYDQARAAVEGTRLGWDYAPLKLLATLLSTLSGIPGGIFAPSLSVGAGVGSIVAPWFPTVPTGAIVVLGMAGYFAGVVQAPITAFVIIIEMTANHTMVLPLMAASVMGHAISRLICPQPLYHTIAETFIAAGRTDEAAAGTSG